MTERDLDVELDRVIAECAGRPTARQTTQTREDARLDQVIAACTGQTVAREGAESTVDDLLDARLSELLSESFGLPLTDRDRRVLEAHGAALGRAGHPLQPDERGKVSAISEAAWKAAQR